MEDDLEISQTQFEALVLQHHVRLRVFVRSLGVDSDWVDDIAQEACLTAFRQWQSFDQTRDFGKWVRGIAANIVRNEVRKDSRRQRITLGPDGSFAGKYFVARTIEVSESDGIFDVEIPLLDFQPLATKKVSQSPRDKELVDWWCITKNKKAKLAIRRVELLSEAP